VLFVVLAVLGGSGLVIYLAMWIIVPNEPAGAA
jgi:phage shock protein PspC (stress-responsive transcriptional regulator)